MTTRAKQHANGESKALKRAAAWLVIVLLAGLFIYAIRGILPPFIIGVMIAYFLHPVADRLEKHKWPRGLAAGLIVVVFFALIAAALALVAPLIVHQCTQLAEDLPEDVSNFSARYGDRVHEWMSYLAPDQAKAIQKAAGDGATAALKEGGTLLVGVFAGGVALINIVALLLITPVVAFFLLRDWDMMTARLNKLLPRASAPTIRAQLRRIDDTLAGFLRGQLNVCLILAVYYGLLLTLVGLKFGLVLGLATGALVILPYVGALSMFATSMVIGYVQFGFTQELLLVGVVYGVGQLVEGYLLTPRLVGERVGLHPLWIIFGMLSGGALFGFVGVLLAVPTTAVIGVLIRFAVERYLASPLYAES